MRPEFPSVQDSDSPPPSNSPFPTHSESPAATVSDAHGPVPAQVMVAAIVESSDDAIVSHSLEGRVLTWNPGAARLFGVAARDAIGQPIERLIPRTPGATFEALADGARSRHFETEHVSRSGEAITISIAHSPIRDDQGRSIGVSMIGRDITAHKRAVASLMSVKNELATQVTDLQRLHQMSIRHTGTHELGPIMEDALTAVAAVEGADLGLVYLCEPDNDGLRIGASLGFADEFVSDFSRLAPGYGACGTAFAQRRRVVVEDIESDPEFAQFRDVARRLRIRAAHSTPLIARSGKIVGVLTVHFREPHRPTERAMRFADLCARQAADSIENARLYQELREADRARNEFLATLAHELRNPLAPIRNAAETLKTLEAGAAHSTLEVIDRQVGHMTRLVDDLLDIARITAGKLELRRERVGLDHVIAAAVETCRAAFDARRQQLFVQAPAHAITIDVDPTRLAQVVSNLLGNASKFSPDGAIIHLVTDREGDEATIRVRDPGIGIPADARARIFEMFCQGATSDRTHEGLGIGLTLVQRITEMHGGAVHAYSDGPGTGSEFVVRLPATAEEEQERPVSQPRSEEVEKPAGRRMLIVDDNRDAADSLGMLMKVMGNDTRVAYDGREALNVASTFHPEVVLLDIGLPTLSGYEVARELRRRPGGSKLLLIATTGWSQPSDKEQSRQAGFDHHLVKPVDPGALVKLLDPR